MKVFVSHGSHDAWIARQMARCIAECGAEVIIDAHDVETGDNASTRIFGLLGEADELVVLFTPHPRNRAWVWTEVGVMRSTGRRVVPIFHGLTKRDLGDTGGDGVLADIVERQLNDFDHYLVELRGRIGHETRN